MEIDVSTTLDDYIGRASLLSTNMLIATATLLALYTTSREDDLPDSMQLIVPGTSPETFSMTYIRSIDTLVTCINGVSHAYIDGMERARLTSLGYMGVVHSVVLPQRTYH